MYIRDGVAYAGEVIPPFLVSGVHALEGHKLWVRFNTGEAKVFDLMPLLGMPAFAPLVDPNVFMSVYIDYGVAVWNGGDIDIAPERLYNEGVAVEEENQIISINLPN